ncbi:MAG: hypothetical protein DHS20C02_18930 [Micavibrio sp.]|nr:MAG: hypothetical protein DHS20C02_18930 [Micavibrio sp.]
MKKLMRPLEKRLMLDASLVADIGGSVLWLDGDDQASILDADGDDASSGGAFSGTVATWQDKSGNNNDMTQGNGAREATFVSNVQNGNSVLRFDGGDDFLSGNVGALGNEYTTFAVGYFGQLNQGVNDYDYLASIGSGGAYVMSSISRTASNWGPGADRYYAYDGSAPREGPVIAGQTWNLYTQEITPGAPRHSLRIDGANQVVEDSAANHNNNGQIGIGHFSVSNTHHLNGDVGEILIFDGALSADSRHDIENYLATKWGLANTNIAPVNIENTGALFSNSGTVTLDKNMLLSTDADNTDSRLIYTVTTLAANGTMELNGVAINVNDTFTQQDIINGNVTYDHNPNVAGSDSFHFTVSDRFDTSAVQTFNFNPAANQTTNAPITLDEGASTDITNTDLSATNTNGVAWYDANWDYRQKLTIDSGMIGSDLTNFTMMLSDHHLSSDFWAQVKADGSDIVVTSADGTTKLSRDMVSFDNVGESIEMHIKVPLVSSTVDTDIYLYFGNAAGTETNDTAAWSDFSGVWHLDELAGNAIDSTVNANNGTINGGLTQGVTGHLGRAADFDDANDLISIAMTKGAISTFSFWATWDGAGNDMPILAGPNGAGPDLFLAGGNVSWNTWNGSANAFGATPAAASDGAFHHYTLVVAPGNTNLYFDNTLVGTATYADPSATTIFQIGGIVPYTWGGAIDEMRVSNVARSADWVAAEYNNQIDPSSFFSSNLVETQDETLTYTVTDLPNSGALNLNGAALNVNDMFTQDDIDNNRITYVHDDSDTTLDSFDFRVSNILGNVLPVTQTFTLNINAINDAPINNPVADSSDDAGSNNNSSQRNENDRTNLEIDSDNSISSTGEIIRSILSGSQSSFYGNALNEIMRTHNTFEISRTLEDINDFYNKNDDKVINVIERGLNDEGNKDDPAWWDLLETNEVALPEEETGAEASTPDLSDQIMQDLGTFDQNLQDFLETL